MLLDNVYENFLHYLSIAYQLVEESRKISGDFFNLPKYWIELLGTYVGGS